MWLVGFTMGICGVLSGILVVLLPETKDVHMPNTVEEIEERAKAALEKINKQRSAEPKSNNEECEEESHV